MIHRLLDPTRRESFFLFGPRGTGKTTFLKIFFENENIHLVDLLDEALFDRYLLNLGLCFRLIMRLSGSHKGDLQSFIGLILECAGL